MTRVIRSVALPALAGFVIAFAMVLPFGRSTSAHSGTYRTGAIWAPEAASPLVFRGSLAPNLRTTAATDRLKSADNPWNNKTTSYVTFRSTNHIDVSVRWTGKACNLPYNGVVWILSAPLEGAVARTNHCRPAGQIRRSSIRFDNDGSTAWYTGTETPGLNVYDLWGTATHEFGHVGGWSNTHLSGADCPNSSAIATMCTANDPSLQRFKRTLSVHDIHTYGEFHPGRDGPGVYRNSNRFWYLREVTGSGASDHAFKVAGPTPNGWVTLSGDWDGDGNDTPGIYRDGTWYLTNSIPASSWSIGPITFGAPNTTPVVGDWDGDGDDNIGYVDGNIWNLRYFNSTGAPTTSFSYGKATGDVPIVGDWNRDGYDTVGIRRSNLWYLRNALGGGKADVGVFSFGLSSDTPTIGDWDGDGDDSIGVFRAPNRWLLRNQNTSGAPQLDFYYGTNGDQPVPGDWDGF